MEKIDPNYKRQPFSEMAAVDLYEKRIRKIKVENQKEDADDSSDVEYQGDKDDPEYEEKKEAFNEERKEKFKEWARKIVFD